MTRGGPQDAKGIRRETGPCQGNHVGQRETLSPSQTPLRVKRRYQVPVAIGIPARISLRRKPLTTVSHGRDHWFDLWIGKVGFLWPRGGEP
jgi:hypothetical protein